MLGDLAKLDGWHTKEHWPRVTCHECKDGTLGMASVETHYDRESAAAEDLASRQLGPSVELNGTFEGYLECDGLGCGQEVTVAGDWQYVYDESDFSTGGLVNLYRLRYMAPASQLLHLPDATPPKVATAVREASEVLWLSPSSAANRLRYGVEELMTALNVPETTVNPKNNKNVRMTLHARIEHYSQTDAQLGDTLLAMKWIGNGGSHDTDLAVADVVLGAQLLDFALTKLYDRSTADLLSQAQAINANKGLPKV